MSLPNPVPTNSPSQSKSKLLAFAAVVALIFGGTVLSGWLQRDRIRQLGGNLHVHVLNETPTRYRTDLIVDGAFTTLELNAGEKALVRFAPHRPTAVELRQFRKNVLIGSVASGTYEPGQKAQLQFVLKGNNEIKIIPEGNQGGT